MTDERQEQRILSLITQAALRNDDESYVELWTAARAINDMEIEQRAAMTTTLLGADPIVLTIWVTFLLDALKKMEAAHDELAQGVPFDYDGMTLVAAPVENG